MTPIPLLSIAAGCALGVGLLIAVSLALWIWVDHTKSPRLRRRRIEEHKRAMHLAIGPPTDKPRPRECRTGLGQRCSDCIRRHQILKGLGNSPASTTARDVEDRGMREVDRE